MPDRKKSGNTFPLPEGRIERLNLRLSGSGGQGIISTGMILGMAISLGDGRNVSQSHSYGPEARGGATRVDVIISDGEIYFPECDMLDLLVAFTYEAYEKYAVKTKERGLIIADESAVDVLVGTAPTLKMPFIKRAKEKFGKSLFANIISLGFLSTYTKIVTQESIHDSVMEQFEKSRFRQLNLDALKEGFHMGIDY
jgi:2-oxoglutarate ferredoxin oxidoreductase subunit gamma